MTRYLSLLFLGLAVSFTAPAQSLQVSATYNGGTQYAAAGGSVNFAAGAVGQPVLINITTYYTGNATATIRSLGITGTSEMTIVSAPSFPLTLNPTGSASFTLQYLPASGSATGQISIAYTENNQPLVYQFAANGVAPNLTFSYYFAPNGSLSDLHSGDRISFPATNLGSSVTATVRVMNRGSVAGLLQAVTVSGPYFQLSGSPGAVWLQPGQQVSFDVTFAPQSTGGSQGLLTLGSSGGTASFTLAGSGTAASLSVSYALADGNTCPLPDGGAIAFPAVNINGTASAAIGILNQGTGPGTVTAITVSGSGFKLNGVPLLPATIAAGQALIFGAVFTPTQAGNFVGSVRIDMTGHSVTASLAGSTASPNLSLSYTDPDTGSVMPLQNGSTLTFPKTLTSAVSNITAIVANSGAGTGAVNSITLGGASPAVFQLLSLANLPASVAPSQQMRFGIRFSPQQMQVYSATMSLNLDGQVVNINLGGQGTGPQFTYTYSDGTNTTRAAGGGTIAIGDTAVGQTSGLTITILNSGTGDGPVAGISVSGQGLSLGGLPGSAFTLHPNDSQQFTLNFSPAQPGAVSGQLKIGSDTFAVTGTGIGAKLTFQYSNAVGTTPLSNGDSVILTPTAVGDNSGVSFSVQNSGTSATTISSISLTAGSTIFVLQDLPGLPLSLAAGESFGFSIKFLPNNTGTLTAVLRINSSSFTLWGTGLAPPALPSYQFQGPSGTQQAGQQPSLGLSLASPYPMPLQGTLTLSFVSSVFTDDPAVQFASGGRTVKFTIPANSTQALFSGGATGIPFQTGTTAGDIVITPSFAMQSGFDLTPSSPPPLTLTIPRAAPQLLNANVTSETLNSFFVVVNGYVTARSVRQLDILLSPKQGQNFSTTHLTVDVSSGASAWFQGAASDSFGGAFQVTIPFVLQNGSSSDDLVHRLQSLTITASNEAGSSSTLTVTIP